MPLLVSVVLAVCAGALVAWLARREPGVTFRRLSVAPREWVVLAAGSAVVVLAVVTWRWNDRITSVDLWASRWAATHEDPLSTYWLSWCTWFGAGVTAVALVVVVAVWDLWRRRDPSAVAFLVVVLVGQDLIANGLKLWVGRVRPDLDRLTSYSGASFPSGHATTAAAVLLACALVLARGRSTVVRVILLSGAAALAVLVASSRVMLGVHWLSDVLAGLALGWSWTALCAALWARHDRRSRLRQPTVEPTRLR